MIDFDAIKSKHRIEDVLVQRYNVVLRRASGGWLVKCPIHNEQHGAAFSINERKQLWRCHGKCQTGGSVLDLVMAMDGAADAKAAAEILEGRPLTEEERTRPKQERTVNLQFDHQLRTLPKFYRAQQLKKPADHYFGLIARARKLDPAAISSAHDAGCLRFCHPQWREGGERYPCYAILDIGNPCNVQFRRLDCDAEGKALPFWRDIKVMGWKGNKGNWPVGIDNALQRRSATILLVEGTGDFLAAWDIHSLGLHEVAPVAMLGASAAIATPVLPFFERRNVIIIQQHDPAAQHAAERWTQQLTAAHARVRTWVVPEEGADLNDYISGGGDVNVIIES